LKLVRQILFIKKLATEHIKEIAMNTLMQHNGFKARIMEAHRLTGDGINALPPGSALPIYLVSEFKKHPDNWMEEDGCYVVPVNPDKGLWFDWTGNDILNTAVVPTVKGCNPITGMKTDRLGLERYEKKCPKHGIEFIHDRYCEKCGYKWAVQNYISSPNILWWDTWYTGGIGRQLYFTKDDLKDIAGHMIGKENTVPAFGFAFFKPKIMRTPEFSQFPLYSKTYIVGDYGGYWQGVPTTYYLKEHPLQYYGGGTGMYYCGTGNGGGGDFTYSNCCSCDATTIKGGSVSFTSDVKGISKGILKNRSDYIPATNKKEVSIGAGAKIDQKLIVDPYELDTWKEEPDSIMRIYFVFHDEFEHWKSFGMRDFDGTNSDGMLKGLPIG